MDTDAIPHLHDVPGRPAPVRLARRIARAIIEDALPVGTRLGSLPDIAARHGVSVPTLRKAITYLQEDGFVIAREGRGGGLMVAAPPGRTAARAMYLFLSGLDPAPARIEETRDLVNVALAERACRLVDEVDQQRVEAILRSARERPDDAGRIIREFDEAILAAAKQPVLALVSNVLDHLDHERGGHAAPDIEDEFYLRRETARAIVGGNLADAIDLKRRLRPMPVVADEPSFPLRLPDQIADSIRQMIRDRRLSPGDEIGHERALQDMFGVGRSTLRDALRPLERAGAIRVSQGRGGGIFVGSAEPYAAVEMASLYLSSARLTVEEQIESRQILEARAAWLAAERITPALREKLERAMKADAAAAAASRPDWAARGTEVERLIAHACGNPLLEFFTLALVDLSLSEARRQGFRMAIAPVELARFVSLHHGRIVDAILAGQPAKAAFNTRQYLRQLGQWINGPAAKAQDAGKAG